MYHSVFKVPEGVAELRSTIGRTLPNGRLVWKKKYQTSNFMPLSVGQNGKRGDLRIFPSMQPSSSPPFRMPMMTDITLPNEGPLSFSLIIENVPERWKKNVFPITLQNATMEKMSISSISTDGTTFRTVKKNATWLLVFEVKNVGFCITWSMAASCYIFYQVAAAHSKRRRPTTTSAVFPFLKTMFFPSTLCLHSTNLPFAHLYYTMACLMG